MHPKGVMAEFVGVEKEPALTPRITSPEKPRFVTTPQTSYVCKESHGDIHCRAFAF